MTDLQTIVDVEISLSATPVPVASFQNMAVIAAFETFAERIRYYSSATFSTAMIADGFTAADAAYKMVNACFTQPNPPIQVALLRKDEDDADWTVALNAVAVVDSSWFGFCADTVVKAEILLVAAWAASHKKVYLGMSRDVDIGTNVNTDVVSVLKALNYDRVACLYHAANEYEDCAWMAARITQQPGSNTWKFTELVGITPDDALSDTFVTYAKGKNCNLYQTIGGVPITGEGVMVGGLFIDIRIGADWQGADMQNKLYTYMLNASRTGKVSLTDTGGLAGMEQQIRASLRDGIRYNFGTNDPPIQVFMPKRADLSDADRAARRVTGITWQMSLADAAHSVVVRGTIVP